MVGLKVLSVYKLMTLFKIVMHDFTLHSVNLEVYKGLFQVHYSLISRNSKYIFNTLVCVKYVLSINTTFVNKKNQFILFLFYKYIQ